MSPEQFTAYVDRTRLKPRARRMAEAVLVEGISAAEAARREGVTRESARAAAARVMREVRSAGGYPVDWVTVTEVVPPEIAEEIRDVAKRAHRAAGLLVD